jgi:hypothetical protein
MAVSDFVIDVKYETRFKWEAEGGVWVQSSRVVSI